MRKFLLLVAIIITASVQAQDLAHFRLYNPGENAEQAIAAVVKKAKAEKKHVLIQIGGNWCIWCARFHAFVTKDSSIDSLVKRGYVVYHLNYSPENKNEKLLAKYQFPQRFGFPVFLILDGNGKLLHTQNSAYLEEGEGYSRKNVMGFFTDWSPVALDPGQYKKE